MSNTGLKFVDSDLHCMDSTFVAASVFASRNEPNVARRVTLVNIDSIHVVKRVVMPIKADQMGKEFRFVGTPFGINSDTPPAVSSPLLVIW
jgi:hypothetical protein